MKFNILNIKMNSQMSKDFRFLEMFWHEKMTIMHHIVSSRDLRRMSNKILKFKKILKFNILKIPKINKFLKFKKSKLLMIKMNSRISRNVCPPKDNNST
jgi:hypothetical protein